MQWFKGSEKISEGAKFKVKYVQCGENEWEVMLDISVSRTYSHYRKSGRNRIPGKDFVG